MLSIIFITHIGAFIGVPPITESMVYRITKGDKKENMVASPILIIDAKYKSLFPFIKSHNNLKFFTLPPTFKNCHKKATG